MFKKRSKYGEFLDKHGIEQERVREHTKLGRDTLTRVCNTDKMPNGNTMRKLIEAARELSGNKTIKQDDFWPM